MSLIVYLIGEGVDFLVGLSVAAACVSYTLSMSSFIKLRLTEKDETRPYKSPLGIFGAGYAAALSILVGISFFVDIGVGLGPVVLIVVIVVFILIYLLYAEERVKLEIRTAPLIKFNISTASNWFESGDKFIVHKELTFLS